MNAKMMIAGMTLIAGLGAALPAQADNYRFDAHGRRIAFEVRDRYYAPVVAAPIVVAPAPVCVTPAPVVVVPAPEVVPELVVEDPVIVAGGYYCWEGGRRVFHRGRPAHFRR